MVLTDISSQVVCVLSEERIMSLFVNLIGQYRRDVIGRMSYPDVTG